MRRSAHLASVHPKLWSDGVLKAEKIAGATDARAYALLAIVVGSLPALKRPFVYG